VARAVAEGVEPGSAAGDAIVTELAGEYARVFGRADDVELRHWLLHRLDVANDPEVERYWLVLSEINGWTIPESLGPVYAWLTAAVRAQVAGWAAAES
jgi:hypothetical protein